MKKEPHEPTSPEEVIRQITPDPRYPEVVVPWVQANRFYEASYKLYEQRCEEVRQAREQTEAKTLEVAEQEKNGNENVIKEKKTKKKKKKGKGKGKGKEANVNEAKVKPKTKNREKKVNEKGE